MSPAWAQSFNFPRWLRRHEMTAAQSPATRTGMEQFHGIQPYAARPGPAATRRRCSVVMVGFSRGWSVVKLVTSRPFQRVIYRGHCSRSCGVKRGSGWVRTYCITTSSKPFVLSHFIHLIKDCCVRVWAALHPASIIHSLYSSVCSVLPDSEIFPALKSVSYTNKYLH